MTVEEALQTAFSGESQANRRYVVFAERAQAQGYPEVARLFRAAAESEAIHARAMLRAMAGIGDTLENLQRAAAGEHHESTELYPRLIQEASRQGDRLAVKALQNALETEIKHEELYRSAITAVEKGEDLPPSALWICRVCGYVHAGAEAPDPCPVCGVPGTQFYAVD